MPKPIVFLTRLLPLPVMERLEPAFDLRFDPKDRLPNKADIMAGASTADGMITMLSDCIDQEVFASAPKLKIVSNYAVGYNNIDLAAAKARGIAVTNTPGVLTETTADLTFALLMAAARRIPEADQWVKSGQWSGWAPTEMMGFDIFGKTLGLIGMGRIAQAVARRAAGFKMKVNYFSRHALPSDSETDLAVSYLPFSRLLATSDYLSLHLPLTPESHHLIDEKALQQMKPTAFLINTARGPIVDEQALYKALATRQIAGAGLDVFEAEPYISPALLQFKNVVTLPHIGSASQETRVKMGFMVMDNLLARFSGHNPPNMVD